MKKPKIYLIILSVLVLVAAVLTFVYSSGSTLDEDTEFALADTASVSKIFLADKKNHTVLLERNQDGSWMLNKQHKASSYATDIFLKTIMDIEVKSPVSKEAHKNTVNLLATVGVKVEIYQKDYRIKLFDKIKWFEYEKLAKVYYVGMSTQDNLGTYMILEGSETPYIVHIPGFNGYLTTRYSPLEKDWRDHTVFALKYRDIKSVSLQFPETPEKSFRAEKTGMKAFMLYTGPSLKDPMNIAIPQYDTLKLMDLFGGFHDIRYEAIVDPELKTFRDSVMRARPFHIMKIETNDGQLTQLKTWHVAGPPEKVDENGNPQPWDLDRMYATLNNEDLLLIQFYVFDPLIRPLQFYLPAAQRMDAPNK